MNSCKTKSNLISSYYSRIKELYGEKNADMLLNGSDIDVDGEVPFLSVVMRTQGKRICALKEALLCLYSQTCKNFEVLLMAHNVDDTKAKEIEELVSSFPHDFLNKIRLIPVSGGTRTTPLTEGFKAARGIYISIYDDDDIVFDNWVETFRSLYDEAPGRILHAYATEQDWTVLKSGGSISLTTCSAPKPVYCCKFNMVNQLSINRCPTMSLAFPFYSFKFLNIGFDESLNTTEDWDFLMRTAFVCGVADSENVTSIYRKWVNSDNSHTEHSDKEWQDNYKKIQDKLGRCYVPVKAGDIIYDTEGSGSYVDTPRNVQIFVSGSDCFDSVKPDICFFDNSDSTLTVSVTDLDKFGKVGMVRLDPDIYGNVLLGNFKMVLIDKSGNEIKYKTDFFRSNHTKSKGDLLFYGFDPQIAFKVCEPALLGEINITCSFSKQVSVRRMTATFVPYVFKYTVRKIAGLAYRVVKKLKR